MRSARIYVPRTKFGILCHVAVTCLGVLAIGYFAETISSPAALIPIAEGYGIVGAAIVLNIFLIARLANPRNKMATDEWNGRVVTCLCSAGLTMGVAIFMKNE